MIYLSYDGGAVDGALTVVGARVVALDTVVLAIDANSDPGFPNPQRATSVYYWGNWTLVALSPLGARTRLVKLVTLDEEAHSLRVVFDGRLQPGAEYQLTCAVAEIDVTFHGIGAHPTATRQLEREQIIQDWANPERARDTQGGEIGTVQIVGGDLGLTSGAASLYERVIHRCQAVAGQMAHDPTYGLEWRQGGLLTVDALQRIQSRLLAQIRQEPDVVRVSVAVGQVPASPGVVTVSIQADTVDGPLSVETTLGRS